MELHLLRHGQTDANAKQLLAGLLDTTLTDQGRQEVRDAIASIPEGITHIFCSTLRRTRESCDILNVNHLPVIYTDNLKERHFGIFQGKTWAEAATMGPAGLQEKDRNLEYDYTPYGGESAAMVQERIHALFKEIKEKIPPDGKVLLVTSSGIIKMMQKMAAAHDPELRTKNAGIYGFELRDDNSVEKLPTI